MYNRLILKVITSRLNEPKRFIQVIAGPRQVGKTTLAQQAIQQLKLPAHFISADEPTLHDRTWLAQQWEIARLKLRQQNPQGSALLVVDEVPKIPSWSETIKRLWDEDIRAGIELKVILLGSAPLLMQKGLTESLAGRFEIIPATHWSYQEMRDAFDWTLPQYIYFGGYPGAASLIHDEQRWRSYILDALIEPTIARDILLLTRIDKPALLRQLLRLGCEYSGQIVAFQKLLGQLHDAGNTTTLAHYLNLLNAAGMLRGLPKYAAKGLQQRASIPKLQVLNTALMTAYAYRSFEAAQQERDFWGRLVESAVGAYLANATLHQSGLELFYWRERSLEVDFVLRQAETVIAFEIASGIKKSLQGMQKFDQLFKPKRQLLIGGQGISLETFFTTPLTDWLQ